MKIDIIRNRIKDPQKFQIILKTFEYFASTNFSREETMVKSKDKEGIIKLLFELINYIEPGLRKRFSENYNVLISENGTYALKFDPKEFLGLRYGVYDILVYKTPYICVPAQFYKKIAKDDELINVNQAAKDMKAGNFSRYFKLINFRSKEDIITEDFMSETILEAVAFHSVQYPEDDLSRLCQLIQHDLASKLDNFNWCVVISKKILASQDFINNANVIYQIKFNDLEKNFHLSKKLNDNEIFIFKKQAVFESVLKNIVTGKLYDIELKHIIILISLVVFVFLVGLCKNDYSASDLKLTWFEENVCKNKRNIFGGIGLMFIFAIIFGFLKAKMNKKKNERTEKRKVFN